ncbi:hypothetical protein Y1Q_0013837 [Alligator mississippiensis]|uniref:Uncharacterized protein n=1 Tax=Alligator mississippiensis TaxID=8496 RepID=A0A151NFQ8_ALLMI|nr:hypothetical protein Y1Q_0013837 [Alligator mississippiensis]
MISSQKRHSLRESLPLQVHAVRSHVGFQEAARTLLRLPQGPRSAGTSAGSNSSSSSSGRGCAWFWAEERFLEAKMCRLQSDISCTSVNPESPPALTEDVPDLRDLGSAIQA